MPVLITPQVLLDAKKKSLSHQNGKEWYFSGVDICDLWMLPGVSMFAALPEKVLNIPIKQEKLAFSYLLCNDGTKIRLLPETSIADEDLGRPVISLSNPPISR